MSENEIQTIDYLFSLDEQGVIVHTGGNVVLNDLREWLDTPRGSVMGRPSWGNELEKFKHENMNDDLAVSVENSIARGLTRDLQHLAASSSVSVKNTEFDKYEVTISTPWGNVSRFI